MNITADMKLLGVTSRPVRNCWIGLGLFLESVHILSRTGIIANIKAILIPHGANWYSTGNCATSVMLESAW